jgi:hypothetical protein
MMKRSLFALILTALAGDALAATPPSLVNYQGVLRNAANAPQSGPLDMEFAFFDDTDPDCGDGLLLLTDSHLAAGSGDVTVTGGLFNVALGSGLIGIGFESSLAGVFANHSSVFMEVRIEGGGGVLETCARGSACSPPGIRSVPTTWTASTRPPSSTHRPARRPRRGIWASTI